jgi:hypothetical protein
MAPEKRLSATVTGVQPISSRHRNGQAVREVRINPTAGLWMPELFKNDRLGVAPIFEVLARWYTVTLSDLRIASGCGCV